MMEIRNEQGLTCHEMVVIIRPSLMRFCQDGCRAAVLNHILYWIARKAKGQPQKKTGAITYYATTEELTACLANAWGSEKVRKEVNALVNMGIVGRGKNPGWGTDRTKHFFFGQEQGATLLALCQEQEICLLHIGLPTEIVHMIAQANHKSVKCLCPEQITDHRNANHKSAKCISAIEDLQVTDTRNANRKSVRAITKNSTKITTKETTKQRVVHHQQMWLTPQFPRNHLSLQW